MARADREALNNVQQAHQAELTARVAYVNAIANYLTSLDQFKKQINPQHVFKDWKQLLAMPGLDAVSVCTPDCVPEVAIDAPPSVAESWNVFASTGLT